MKIADLIPTHNSLRSPRNIKFFSENSVGLIQIAAIDGKYYIHDGHHRCVDSYLRGNSHLGDFEYAVFNKSYEDYMTCNPDVGFVTPFDPRTECRLPDFFNFKRTAMEVYEVHKNLSTSSSMYEALNFHNYGEMFENMIKESHRYKEPRKVNTLKELAEKYRKIHMELT